MRLGNKEAIIEVAQAVQPLGFSFVFTGACVLPFLVEPEFVPGLRTTEDVDLIVQILARTQMAAVEGKLRTAGFRNDYWSDDAHRCKWAYHDIKVDVLSDRGHDKNSCPSEWFEYAAATAIDLELAPQVFIKHITATAFLATKLDAFSDRGKNDQYGSRDWGDIITLLDGRTTLSAEVIASPPVVRDFIASTIRELILGKHLEESVPFHLAPESRVSQRHTRIITLLNQFASL